MTSAQTVNRTEAWEQLATPVRPVGFFDPGDVASLPAPARRLLVRMLAPGVPLTSIVLLDMEGEIKLRRWMPFHARQVLQAGNGFVWEATVGRAPITFRGGDSYWRGRGTLDFRLWGLFPVARADGPDIARSAAGRLAAETVAWAPQVLTPQMGASWTGIDDTRALVTLAIGDHTVDVTVAVDDDGLLGDVSTQRWGDLDEGRYGLYPFGGSFDRFAEFSGVTIATTGRVGWRWGTERQSEGEFFRYRITDARFPVGT